MAVTVTEVDDQLRALCARRDVALDRLDMPELEQVSTLIDGWLASRTALTTTRQGADK